MQNTKKTVGGEREKIESEYHVENGIIKSPGKFEGEPIYAPHFYEIYLNGCADEDDGNVLTFEVNDEDRCAFPELIDVSKVIMSESEQGFIYTHTA
jgi:hypothetical protein